ncbi:hypothetical protein [Streptomyces sp. NPDC020965]|uniref:hypothetical protein n=1 Tax=Streptomyces sp. NPDC020965 TaxID=3365105 RepID=UPI0037895F23
MEWRRLHQGGMRQVQQDWYTLHQQTRHCRVYLSNVPPGFLQTPAFATALMTQITRFQRTPNDVSEYGLAPDCDPAWAAPQPTSRPLSPAAFPWPT